MFNEQNEIYRVLEDSELKENFKYEEIIKKLKVKSENEKNKEKYRRMLIKYINLIFLIKLLKTNYNFFYNLYQEDSKDGDKKSPYELHRAVRYYLIDLFSILDYLEKFEGISINKEGINKLKEEIRFLRNDVVHSSIPKIIYLSQNQNSSVCIADTAITPMRNNEILEVKIRVYEGDEKKEIKIVDLLNLFERIKSLIMDINKEINKD